MQTLFCSILLGLLAPTVLYAQPAPDSVVALPGVTVIATRQPLSTLASPSPILELGRSPGSSHASVADVLESAGGLFLKRYGNGLATLSIRGTSASQSLLLLDGLPLNDPQLGQIDLSLLPSSLLEDVEVMQGGGASLYGSQAMGGVINLNATPLHHAGWGIKGSGGSGSYGLRRTDILVQGATRKLAFKVAADYFEEQGDFSFLNASLFPPRDVPRLNADTERHSIFGSVHFKRGRHKSKIAGLLVDAERGLPGPATLASSGERQWDTMRRLWISHHLLTGQGRWVAEASAHTGSLRYTNERLSLDDTGEHTTWQAGLRREGRLKEFNFVLGSQWNRSMANHPSLLEGGSEHQTGIYGNGSLRIGSASLFPSLRWDRISSALSDSYAALTPGLGLSLQPLPGRPYYFKASAGRVFRAPTLNDRYWQPGGNPDLRPEEGWTYQAGLGASTNLMLSPQLEFMLFTHHLNDQIVWAPGPGGIWSPQNITTVHTRGMEGSLHLKTPDPRNWRVSSTTRYTLTDARDTTPGVRQGNTALRYVPRHTFFQSARLQWTQRLHEAGLTASLRHVSRRYVTTDGSQWLDPYQVLDVGVYVARQQDRGRLELSITAQNLRDTDYTIIKDYPMPPRSIQVRLAIQFHSLNEDGR